MDIFCNCTMSKKIETRLSIFIAGLEVPRYSEIRTDGDMHESDESSIKHKQVFINVCRDLLPDKYKASTNSHQAK